MTLELEVDGLVRTVQIDRQDHRLAVVLDGTRHVLDAREIEPGRWSLILEGGASHEVRVRTAPDGGLTMLVDGAAVTVNVRDPRRLRNASGRSAAGGAGPARITAPMPGKVVRVLVAPGESVAARQGLVVVEAMKMENELRAPRAGTVAEVLVAEGALVETGAALLTIG